jgi:hypothetical protein
MEMFTKRRGGCNNIVHVGEAVEIKLRTNDGIHMALEGGGGSRETIRYSRKLVMGLPWDTEGRYLLAARL